MIVTEFEAQVLYNDMLDEVYGTVEVAGIAWDAHRVLEALDPIAYRVGFNDWCDAEGLEIED